MKLSDVLGCAGSSILLLVASGWIPLIGPFISLLIPLPFLYYSAKLGFYEGLKLAGLSILAMAGLAKLTGYSHAVVFAVELAVLGLILAELFRRRLGLGETVLLGTVFMLAVGFGFLFFVALNRDMGPFEMILQYLRGHLKAGFEAYQQMEVPKEKAAEFKEYQEFIINILSKIFPSLMAIGTGFAVWLNVVLAKPLFRMKGLAYPDFAPMDRWHAPEWLIWGVIASGFALFFASGNIKFVAINILIVMMAVYFFHGLSILLFFLRKYHIPSWIRIGIYVFVMVQQILMAILVVAGLFDQWVDFRRIHKEADS